MFGTLKETKLNILNRTEIGENEVELGNIYSFTLQIIPLLNSLKNGNRPMYNISNTNKQISFYSAFKFHNYIVLYLVI